MFVREGVSSTVGVGVATLETGAAVGAVVGTLTVGVGVATLETGAAVGAGVGTVALPNSWLRSGSQNTSAGQNS